jgi:hypothetical protein
LLVCVCVCVSGCVLVTTALGKWKA